MAKLRAWLSRGRVGLLCRERGQGLMEYGLIISVVSIAAVVLIMAMGPRVASMFSAAGASAFPSDRRRKTNFAAVNKRAVLARLAALPIRSPSYAAGARTARCIAPAAADFHRAFGIGADQSEIALVDASGVALAAVQGLQERLEDQRRQVRSLQTRLAALEQEATSAREVEAVAAQR